MARRVWCALLAASILGGSAAARPAPQDPSFEVASIRRVTAENGAGWILLTPGGRFTAPFSTVRELVLAAYGIQPTQLVGGPDWFADQHFAIEARTRSSATMADVRGMLRRLLRERFALSVHTEERRTSGFALSRVSANRLGPRLRRTAAECEMPTLPEGVPAPPGPPPAPAGSEPIHLEGDRLRCPTLLFTGHWSLRAATTGFLALRLAELVRRPVIDRSGLSGDYDIDLTFAPGVETVDADAEPAGSTSTAPALRTALAEQLGLKLDTATVPLTVIVIDRITMPTEN